MLVHADDFSGYGTSTAYMLNGLYSRVGSTILSGGSVALVNDPDGISSGKVLKMPPDYGGGGNAQTCTYPLPAGATTTIGVALRIWCAVLPHIVNSFQPIRMSSAANPLFVLVVTNTGKLQILNTAGTVIYSTAAPVITATGWWHLEMKVHIDAAAGSIEVRVEGIPVIVESAINTGSTGIEIVSVRNQPDGTSASDTFYVKDFVIWDGSGSQNNDFLGTVLVYGLVTTADVSLNWDTTGPNGYSVLANNPPQDGVAYISAPYPAMPAAAVFALSDLPADITSVKGLITRVRAAKSDGGDGQLQVSLISGVSLDNGANRPITVAQTYWPDVSELDPATGVAWTPVGVDAANLKIDRTL